MGQVLSLHATTQNSFNFYLNHKNEHFTQTF
jgi:hypothetical protein